MNGDRSERVDFFQLVAWLQRTHPGRAEVGHLGSHGLAVEDELLRFRPHLSLAFPPRDIHSVERVPGDQDAPERIRVELNFGGIYGVDSPLPATFTEYLLHEQPGEEGEDKAAVRDFLDIFNHRLYSLLFRAFEKRRFHATFRSGGADEMSQMMLALVGMGTPMVAERTAVEGVLPPLQFLRFGALMMHRPRSAASLRAALQDFLGSIPVRIEQFVLRRIVIDRADRTYLTCRAQGHDLGEGRRAPARTLGRDTIVGDEAHERSSSIRVHIGPLSLDEFEDLLPGASRRRGVDGILRCLSPAHIRHELVLTIAGSEIPPLMLAARSDVRLGWTSWVRGQPGVEQSALFAEA